MEHEIDPFEDELSESDNDDDMEDHPIIAVEPSEAWTSMRMNLAKEMFNTWKASRR